MSTTTKIALLVLGVALAACSESMTAPSSARSPVMQGPSRDGSVATDSTAPRRPMVPYSGYNVPAGADSSTTPPTWY